MMTHLKVREIIGENCITSDDGQKIYDLVHPEMQAHHSVELDFSEVKIFASPFLNAAIGQLLRDTPPDDLNSYLKISNLLPVMRPVLKRVIENAKSYYGDEKTRQAVDEALNNKAAEE